MNFLKKNYSVSAVYIHVPFCRKICPFCSFAVIRNGSNLHDKYVLGILDEIEYRLDYLKDIKNDYLKIINKK